MEYDSLLQNMAERWDMTPAQLENVMGRISYHESKDDPYVYQTSGGPGRGLFQFEEGDAQGGATAANRLITTLGDTPEWLAPFEDSAGTVKNIKASKLTPEAPELSVLAGVFPAFCALVFVKTPDAEPPPELNVSDIFLIVPVNDLVLVVILTACECDLF